MKSIQEVLRRAFPPRAPESRLVTDVQYSVPVVETVSLGTVPGSYTEDLARAPGQRLNCQEPQDVQGRHLARLSDGSLRLESKVAHVDSRVKALTPDVTGILAVTSPAAFGLAALIGTMAGATDVHRMMFGGLTVLVLNGLALYEDWKANRGEGLRVEWQDKPWQEDRLKGADEHTDRAHMGPVGRAVVGDLLLGPAGMLIGAATADKQYTHTFEPRIEAETVGTGRVPVLAHYDIKTGETRRTEPIELL